MVHMDYISIPEGCLSDLIHAYRLDYELSRQHRPQDVVVVAGYNDLLLNNSREFIMEGYQHLSELVLGHDKDSNNTFAVATLLYPPRLSWFADNGDKPRHYSNKLEKIDWLNSQIHELNVSNSVPDYPRFHTYGVRTATRSRVDVFGYEHQTHTKAHRWEHWAEQGRRWKLNLRAERKFKMGTALTKYFSLNTR